MECKFGCASVFKNVKIGTILFWYWFFFYLVSYLVSIHLEYDSVNLVVLNCLMNYLKTMDLFSHPYDYCYYCCCSHYYYYCCLYSTNYYSSLISHLLMQHYDGVPYCWRGSDQMSFDCDATIGWMVTLKWLQKNK